MKKIFTASCFFLLCFFQKAKACDCFPIPSFCETITYGNNGQIWNFLSVYRVKVAAVLPDGVKVSIFQTYAGEDFAGHQLYIKNGSGADCVLFASTFLSLEKEYIIAAQLLNDTLSVSECGISYLKIENGKVQGAIAPGVTEVAVSDFPNTANCGSLTSANVYIPDAKFKFIVTPTLATDFVNVGANQTFWNKANTLKLVVFDALGRIVFTENYIGFDYYRPALIDTKSWSSGVYLLHIKLGTITETVKIVKIR